MSLQKLDLAKEHKELFPEKTMQEVINNPLLARDVWNIVDDLGLIVSEHLRLYTINFFNFFQDWFKILSKLYILKRSSLKLSCLYIKDSIGHLRKFSKFLKQKSFDSFNQINNQVFEEFSDWLVSSNLRKKTIVSHLSTLNNFFNTCRLEGWLNINTYWFKDKLKHTNITRNNEVKYIPEEVWNQLEENLYYLPEPMQRKVLLIRTLGLRIGELLTLPLDCLRKRGDKWHLRLNTEKYNIEDELPLPLELVLIIQEQQKYIQQHFGQSYHKLFCSNSSGKSIKFQPVARVMCGATFNRWLNQLAKKYSIRSKDDNIWHFTSHQFRRTVATVMTNAGVRDLIIQKYLRHRSPDMQNHYKHLLQQVLKDEYEELMREKTYVDITGKVVAVHKPTDIITEYMRRRMHQITTQVGECHRPNLKKPCLTVNACSRCKYWRNTIDDLPFLKEDLKQISKEEEISRQLGLIRNQKELVKDISLLEKRIESLNRILSYD